MGIILISRYKFYLSAAHKKQVPSMQTLTLWVLYTGCSFGGIHLLFALAQQGAVQELCRKTKIDRPIYDFFIYFIAMNRDHDLWESGENDPQTDV